MWRTTLAFLFLLLAGCRWTQAQDAKKKNQAVIQRTKSVLASSLDINLPKVSLEFFLKYEAGGAPIDWEVNDCGEQTSNQQTEREGYHPMCVEADFEKDRTAVAVLVSVGTFQTSPSGPPAVFGVTVNGPSGRVHSLRRLGDPPRELHRPTRGMPRDLPIPTTASSE